MRFGVLGPLAVWTAGGEPVAVPGAKVRALLAVLLLNDGRPVSADRLIDDLWGDDPPRRNPLGALSAKVSQLRRALEDAQPGARELVVSRPPAYRLLLDDEAVDVRRFHTLTTRARQAGDPRAGAALFAEALALWRGPAFADFADEPFAQPVIARLAEQRLTTLEDAAEARLALGEHAVLAAELGDLVAAHPLRERLRAAYMRALYGAGRQSEALESYEELRRLLGDELGLDPGPELAALQRAILTQDLQAPPAPDRRPRSNLPAPHTELIGRESAVAEIGALLREERLVTLTGPGGVGKTRLATEVADGRRDLPDGVWLVELAGVRNGARTGVGNGMGAGAVADAVTAALDIREGDHADLSAALRSRDLLLVLDNCEHVIDEVAALAERLLRTSPGLRILATSREPLALAGEVVWDVPPLDVPGRDAEPGALAESSAVRLFVARTAAAVRGFTLDDGNAAAVGLLCRRLDGIPLALELAATRVRALGVQGVVDRLDDRFRLLATGHRGAPPRQRTLMAMIDWSWELLTVPERTVLRRLAVHADGCTVEAAESVCGGDDLDVLTLLVRLVDRSLVVMLPTPEGPRYRLLESVAAYCADRLAEAGERERIRRRHRDHYLALAERAAPLLRGPEQRHTLRLLDAEAANLRAALDHCLADSDAAAALRLTGALAWHWFLRGRLTEARRSLQAALVLAEDGTADGTGHGTADGGEDGGEDIAGLADEVRIWLAGFAALQGDIGDTAVAERLDAGRGRAGWFLAHASLGYLDLADSEKLLARALDAAVAEGDRWAEAAALMTRAQLAHVRGDLTGLERDAARSARMFAEIGDRFGRMGATGWLAALAEATGDHAHATRLHREALGMAEELGLWPEVSTRLCWLGWIHTQLGDHAAALDDGARALRLAGEQGYRTGEIFAGTVIAYASRRGGDLDTAETHLRRLLEAAPYPPPNEDDPPSVHVPMLLVELGFAAELRGDADAALRLHLEAFDLAARLDAPRDQVGALEGLAGALALTGDHAAAAEVFGAAEAARDASRLPPAPAERADLDRVAAACRAALGEEAFAAVRARGALLGPEAARARHGRDHPDRAIQRSS
ncbi:AfsR/SARP family transcriptional regulator [Microbispora cellulosiformans]|uniref:AfsR/SARP family transcriptional regulator n=1 Tax=Microbispora cellulosiformans TaxID=2614688 RepID=A0A5J5K4I9_9ACTN|nr:BTAD domain-containing putative transcriptional regulator [Microbispora cellulosiformans]KAA9379049.1 AfsR/SARP family transcriptional regulator [Microbispora cellulosiformans]